MTKKILKKLLRQVRELVSTALTRNSVEVRSEAFCNALKPIKRYRSKMESTSRGRSWFPRRAKYRSIDIAGRVHMLPPSLAYELDWHGTIRRTAAKVNKCSRRRAAAACAR